MERPPEARVVRRRLRHQRDVCARVELVEEDPHLGGAAVGGGGGERFGALEGGDDLVGGGASVDVEREECGAEPRAQVLDEHRLAAAALAHQHHRDPAAHAHKDCEHLQKRVAREAVATRKKRRRLVAAARHAGERTEHLVVPRVQRLEPFADAHAVRLEVLEEVRVHRRAHRLRIERQEARVVGRR